MVRNLAPLLDLEVEITAGDEVLLHHVLTMSVVIAELVRALDRLGHVVVADHIIHTRLTEPRILLILIVAIVRQLVQPSLSDLKLILLQNHSHLRHFVPQLLNLVLLIRISAREFLNRLLDRSEFFFILQDRAEVFH